MGVLFTACAVVLAQGEPPVPIAPLAPIEAAAPVAPLAPIEAAAPVAPLSSQAAPPDLMTVQADLLRVQLRLVATEERVAELERALELREAAALEAAAAHPASVNVAVGEIVPKAVAFGGPVCVQGRVLDDAVSFGGDVLVKRSGQVNGNAVSFGGRVIVEPGGKVLGNQVSYAAMPLADQLLHANPLDGAGDKLRWLARQLVLLFAFAGAGVLMVGSFPRHIDVVEETLTSRPVVSGLLGLAATGLAALAALILALTIIGLPLALALAGGLVASWLVGFVAFCKACGDKLPIRDVGARRWVAFLAGMLAVACVGALPWVGRVTLVLVGFACVGAALSTRFGTVGQPD